MSTVLVTRPLEEATPTAERLERLGHRVIIAPMIQIDPISFEIPADDRSLIITSKNGARFGLANIGNKARPIFAVGEATAAEARALGFTNITVGPGTARQMIPILLERGIAQKRKYTHLAGNEVAYNIADVLKNEGVDANTTTTYQARPMRSFSLGVQEAFDEGEISHALFYSPRTATIFEEAVADYERPDWLQRMNALALSTRVAENLIGPWKSVRYAIIPTEKALFSMLG
ncbi:MAG: uroporphyrinogen-III synthase [Alphaproteobacteria bacterium]|nr:MAG: uroporphyrinogen-III synthase [Alphaproteobacteria bacterium]